MIHGRLARAIAAALAAPALALALAWAPGGAAQPLCAAAGTSHAAVVIEHGNGSSTSRCVAFGGSTISGEDLLRAANISFATVYYPSVGGDAICQVDGEPQTPSNGVWTQDNCVGPSTTIYWGVFTASYGGAWTPSSGISTLTFRDGDGEGLRFSNSPKNTPPPPSTAGCPAPQPLGGGAPGGGTGGASGGGGSAGSASGPAHGSGSSPATPGSTPSPSADQTPGSGPDASGASANPGEVALGGGVSPAPSGAPKAALLAVQPSGLLGVATAGAAGLGLLALIAIQVVLPRFRR